MPRSKREMLELQMGDLRSRLDTQAKAGDWAGVRKTAGELREIEHELGRLPRDPAPPTHVVGRVNVKG